jgi:hypothetical protein
MKMKCVGFDTPLFDSTISEEEGCVLALLPDSNYFAGFDAAISFEYSKKKTDHGQVWSKKRGVVLIQVTMAATHTFVT